VHAAAAAAAEKVFARQSVHSAAPVAAFFLPASHAAHVVPPYPILQAWPQVFSSKGEPAEL